MENRLLKDKVAVITGGCGGIGESIAMMMAEAGSHIAILEYANNDKHLKIIDKVKSCGVECKIYYGDVGDFSVTKELVADIVADFQSIDILVNNAGITRDGLVLSMSEKDFDDVINTNLKGAFNMIKHVYPIFVRKRSGRIINISSVSGISGNPGQANYASSKAGLIGLTKTVAKELAGRGITSNAIAPGFIRTDMTGAMADKVVDQVVATIPMKKMGEVEDIAAVAVFLAGPLARYITGEVIKVDGGLYI